MLNFWSPQQLHRPACHRLPQPVLPGAGRPPRRSLRALPEGAEPPAVPQVGWLWDRKAAAETRQRLKEQRLRPKK